MKELVAPPETTSSLRPIFDSMFSAIAMS